jgi:hypothetical protein
MSHPLTDALPSYMDALALRQACGEIEERVTRERDEAREMLAKFRGLVEAQTVLKDVMERREARDIERDALRAEVERLRGHITQIWDACQIASHKPASSPYLTRLWMRIGEAHGALTPAEEPKT